MLRRTAAGCTFAAIALLGAVQARAADDDAAAPPASGAASAAAGAFLPFTQAAPADGQRVVVGALAGYDGARSSGTFDVGAQARVLGPLSIRAGGFYSSATDRFRPAFGATVQALRQGRHGVDASFSVSYQAEGFNLVSAVESTLMLGRRFGANAVFLNVVDGYGLTDGEHYGSVRLGAVRPVATNLVVGLDARGRFDLERNFPEPVGEPSLDLVAGPVATYTLAGYALTAYAGGTTVRYRAAEDKPRTGLATGLGFGRVF